MKKIVIDKLMKNIKNNTEYDETKLAEIKYGLEGIYLTISKLIIIGLLAIILGLFKELIIFLLIYNVIRMPSFGLHATKSWICLLTSTIIFILVPLFCIHVDIPIYIKFITGLLLIFLFYKNAPADTAKRPIVNSKRRMIYKQLSVIVVIIFTICSICIENQFLSNSFILVLVVQAFMISPTIYKMFNLSYDNYKEYVKLNSV